MLDEARPPPAKQDRRLSDAGRITERRACDSAGRAVTPRLPELPNVVLLPQMRSATREGRIEMDKKVLINIKTFADGHRPPDMVVPSML